jgi:uncharacterized protein
MPRYRMHMMHTRVVEFEWDDAKDRANQRKHGVTFGEAATSFYDPLGREMPDERHSADEDRWLRLALSDKSRLLVTIFVERSDRIRIVSSRLATLREKKQYEG